MMENYSILIGRESMQLQNILTLLSQTYWAKGYSLETLEKALAHSIGFGILNEVTQTQIAFARVITDFATRFYIVDVVVDQSYRNMGIGNQLIEAIINYEPLEPLRGLLITKDAKELYKKFGFEEYDITCMQKICMLEHK